MRDKDYVRLFKALSDETRVKIISFLKSGQECCACQILEKLPISQPTLSYHMKILMQAKLVHARKQGTWMWYTLDTNMLKSIISFLCPQQE